MEHTAPDTVIRAYYHAFFAANGRELPAELFYENGWYVMRDDFDGFERRHRAKDLVALTVRLWDRAGKAAPAPVREVGREG